MALTTLLEIDEANVVRAYLEELDPSMLSDELKVIELFALEKTESRSVVYLKCVELIASQVYDFRIYDLMLKIMFKDGRKNEAIEDAVYDACRRLPEYSDYFKSLLPKES